MDFIQIKQRPTKTGGIEIYPDFTVGRSKDLMVRGGAFYALWTGEDDLWATDEYEVQLVVDKALDEYAEDLSKKSNATLIIKYMRNYSTASWRQFRNYISMIPENAKQLDTRLVFRNSKVKKSDYASKRLPYDLEEGDHAGYTELISTLYSPEEVQKIEWAIGSVVAGDSVDIQKFVVFYGDPGTGKSTVMNIIQSLFEGYYTTFDAKALTSSSNAFSSEVFRYNPLVAIQHEADFSRIEDNTKLNSIVSHEEISMNIKHKPSYTMRVNCFLFAGTNKPVKITDGRSGIIRRLIDIHPSGTKIPQKRYHILTQKIENFERGAIAKHCLDVYQAMGKNYYSAYRPMEMIYSTDVFFNFVEQNYLEFKEDGRVSLTRAYDMYKAFCDESGIEFRLPKYKFRDELKNYFGTFLDVSRLEGKLTRSVYERFLVEKFVSKTSPSEKENPVLVLSEMHSLLDDEFADCPAQLAGTQGFPDLKWKNNTTKLRDIDTHELHYLKAPSNHIVVDFDKRGPDGEKSLEVNLEMAASWPKTYTELSKSGKGVHLHYTYDGDPDLLSRVYEEYIEIFKFVGDASLRRKLTLCNDLPIAHISEGLPLKGEKMINLTSVQSEKGLRALVLRNLNKEIHPGTKPSIDFILKILDDAYAEGMSYDLTDMRPRILAFANNSTNQAGAAIKQVLLMKFKSEEASEPVSPEEDSPIAFFDVEVFPNLFLISWKYAGPEHEVVHLLNPTSSQIEMLLRLRLIGFNNRRYDNHIVYAGYLGYTVEQIYALSQKIIGDSRNAMFTEAYNISYTDVYDFSSKKQSLKKFEIELGIGHRELGLPWDEPVDQSLWSDVMFYCGHDVIATEKTFEDRHEDFRARQILAELSGLTLNDTTQTHTAKIIFGDDKKPQEKFQYTDLSKTFKGYTFSAGKSLYRGEDPSEGGYVYGTPGIHRDVIYMDVASMHPTSIELLDLFGPYTKKFSELKAVRLAIKQKEYGKAREMFGGALAKYLDDPGTADSLGYALKIVINIVYGLTSAKFDNKFRDTRNVDNIVAKRGALFMIDLKHAVQEFIERNRKEFPKAEVVHIKTDSIKISGAISLDENNESLMVEMINLVGERYGYSFTYESMYSKMALVNNAVYIAKYANGKNAGKWVAVGTQFAVPYVFKTLFSREPLSFEDYCETRQVINSKMYLNFNEGLDEDKLHFVGKVGAFCPITPGKGGGLLVREKDGKYYAVTGTKGYRWMEAEQVQALGKEGDIDMSYFEAMASEAKKAIEVYGSFEEFSN